MSGLDLNSLLSQSINKRVDSRNDLALDLENLSSSSRRSSHLALDLESIAEAAELVSEMDGAVYDRLIGALGTGVGVMAVLEARSLQR